MKKTLSARPTLLVLFSCLLTAGLFACERSSRDYASKSEAQAGAVIQYAANAHPYAVEGATVVREVLPQGDEVLSGEALFVKSCAACHQVTGLGVPGAFPPLANSKYVTSDNTERMASIMLYGLMGPINVNGTVYTSVMTPWGGVLNDQELSAIATYVRGAWGNKASPVGPEVFAAMRQKWGTRAQFNIQELGEEK